ncbi:embryo defective [Tripterygium wilfordii]|uniref:Embryo defective n=1 Tax=Tripterygium wilfordii TaxID=458696 RepID=A0A7J7DXK9_TRIWF|nr:transcription termination factor MTERF2, chloroplastic [Tripterygium wilfordii]KAF5751102.1 embryo defective [Tripterygium wilfordii]
MLPCPQHHRVLNPSLHLHRKTNSIITVHLSTTANSEPNDRRHNSKSTSLLLRHLSGQPPPNLEQLNQTVSPEEKVKLLELALVTKRTPQFPGSIYAQSPSDADVTSSLPPLKTLFRDKGEDGNFEDEEEEEMIMKALKIRRKVTAEVFKDALRRNGKFGITYASNVVDGLPDFIDFVMIRAAALKKLPEFSNSTFNSRARTVIEDLKVVPLTRWLKHLGLTYPKIAELICMSGGNLGSIPRLVEWLRSIHVKGGFVAVALLKSRGNLLERSIEELDEIVEYLECNGIRRDWMGVVMGRCPQLLTYSMDELKTRVGFYLEMGMNEKDFGTMVYDYPRVLGHFTLEEMSQQVNYLKEFGLNNEEVSKLLAFRPQLMGCSIEERWKPLVKYLYYLGISRDGMRRMLIMKPMIFCVDLEKTIAPKVQFFKDIGIRDDAIANMLVKFPPLLTYSFYKKIRPVVIFLMTKAGVGERDIAKVVALGPELLGCSIVHKLEVNVKYFLSLGIRLRQLGEMIADFPMLLRYSLNVLCPKYRYLRRTMVRPLQDLIEFPRFFSYSLDERIIPRHKVLVENRINFKLRYMLASSDEEFHNKVKDAVERRERFESQAMTNTLTDDGLSENSSLVDFSENEVSFSVSQVTDRTQGWAKLNTSENEDSESEYTE